MPVLVRYLLVMRVIIMIHEVQNDQAINDSYHEIDDIFLLFLPQKNSF